MTGRMASERILDFSMKILSVELRPTKRETRKIFECRLLWQNLRSLLSRLAFDYLKMQLTSVS